MSGPAQCPSPNLAQLRIRAELSRRELADLAEVSLRTIYMLEQRDRVPQMATQIKIVSALTKALGVDSPVHPRRLTPSDVWPFVEQEAAA